MKNKVLKVLYDECDQAYPRYRLHVVQMNKKSAYLTILCGSDKIYEAPINLQNGLPFEALKWSHLACRIVDKHLSELRYDCTTLSNLF